MLRDIVKGAPQPQAVSRIVAMVDADVVVLQSFDHDANLMALNAFRATLPNGATAYPNIYAPTPNSGRPSGQDLDNDGRLGEPEDAIGYGAFFGQRAIAILSRYPIITSEIVTFSDRQHPDTGHPLSSVAHEAIPLEIHGKRLWVLVHHATPPVFDGPEDRNGIRNALENQLWLDFLDGTLGPAPTDPFMIVAVANIDPTAGDGKRDVIRRILDDSRLQDPAGHRGKATAHWPPPGPGSMRVSYILPSQDLKIDKTGVFESSSHPENADLIAEASRHRLIWVDVKF